MIRTTTASRVVGGILVAVLLFAPRTRPTFTDKQLLAYARTTYDKREMILQKLDLGNHNGLKLVAEFPCSDLCPEYTVRIIRYDVADRATCEKHGGVVHPVD